MHGGMRSTDARPNAWLFTCQSSTGRARKQEAGTQISDLQDLKVSKSTKSTKINMFCVYFCEFRGGWGFGAVLRPQVQLMHCGWGEEVSGGEACTWAQA